MSEIPKPDWWDRFWSKVAPDGDCKVWIGHRQHDGYGRFFLNGKARTAHKIIYEFHHGPVPKGLCVCHHCDNPACVEVTHLWLGTQKDNIRDAESKGRMNRGEKLTEETVKFIRRSNAKATDLAKHLGVCGATIYSVRSGDSWSHVQ